MALRRKDQPPTRFLACFKTPTSQLFMSIALSQKIYFMPIAPLFRDIFFFSWETLYSSVLSLSDMLRLWHIISGDYRMKKMGGPLRGQGKKYEGPT